MECRDNLIKKQKTGKKDKFFPRFFFLDLPDGRNRFDGLCWCLSVVNKCIFRGCWPQISYTYVHRCAMAIHMYIDAPCAIKSGRKKWLVVENKPRTRGRRLGKGLQIPMDGPTDWRTGRTDMTDWPTDGRRVQYQSEYVLRCKKAKGPIKTRKPFLKKRSEERRVRERVSVLV